MRRDREFGNMGARTGCNNFDGTLIARAIPSGRNERHHGDGWAVAASTVVVLCIANRYKDTGFLDLK